ncbi:MAG: TRAP transporter TatT component family protein [Vicinamibacteria bacterium]|nr:TRAP transporter TatT component family protein [Vicinamibacteria bacterium]
MRLPRLQHPLLPLLLALAVLPGCSVKKIAVNSLGNALAQGGGVYAKDDDPELVREATPFGLKLMESLLEESPKHKGLLYATSSGFTQYAYAFIQQEADEVEDDDLDKAKELRARAKKLYLRALDYGMRGLDAAHPGFRASFRKDPVAALLPMKKKDVPTLIWTAFAWGAAISIDKTDSELTADQYLAEHLARRALELDEAYDRGSIHDFFISYEGARRSVGGSVDASRKHLERADALSKGLRAAPLVAFAETVSVSLQDKAEFEALLNRALAIDVNAEPELRLVNLVTQRRARWLLARTELLFVE